MSLLLKLFAIVGMLTLLGAAFALVTGQGFGAREAPGVLETGFARAVRLATMPPVRRPEGLAVSDARAHWADHCASCHAADGGAATAMGQGMAPRVPDMRLAATQSLNDGQIYWIIQNGVRFSGMPAWGEPRDDDPETWALVDFVRSLPTLAPDAIAEIKSMMPISEHERHEREIEDAFLRGDHGL